MLKIYLSLKILLILIFINIILILLFIVCAIKLSGEISRKEDEESEGQEIQYKR